MKIRSLIGATCMAIGLASPGFASFHQIEFSVKTLTGVFWFSSIADGEQPLGGINVDGYGSSRQTNGEFDSPWYDAEGTFTFLDGKVTSASFSGFEPYGLDHYQIGGDTDTATFSVLELLSPIDHPKDWTRVKMVTGPIHFGKSAVLAATVPLPASFPLLFAGLAGLVGLRHRRRRAGRGAAPNPSPAT